MIYINEMYITRCKISKGCWTKLLEKLNKCGIFTVLDLLLYFPRDYEFLRSNIPLNEIDEEDKQVLTCVCVENR